MSAAEHLRQISANGINVDIPGAMREKSRLAEQELVALDELNELFEYHVLRKAQPSAFSKKDERFNPRSLKHINAWLVWKGEQPTKTVREDVLEQLLGANLAGKVMAARRLAKHQSDLQSLRNHTAADEKIHCRFVEAITGRWYTGSPNIQTMSKICREFLVPDEGNRFYVIDWSQQELRILAHLSQEPALLDDFANGRDPHLGTYARVTGNDFNLLEPGSPEWILARDLGKLLNYALVYGQDAQGLGTQLRIPNDLAQALIEKHFARLPRLVAWREEVKAAARENGFITTIAGRQIKIDQDAATGRDKNKLDRQAVSYTVQGSGADQLEQALYNVDSYGDVNRMLDRVRMTIHDALLVELPDNDAGQKAAEWFRRIMELPFHGIDIPSETKGPASNWREAMDMKSHNLELVA